MLQKQLKRQMAGTLAAAMVMTMAAGPAPVYAESTGTSVFEFITESGPDMSYTNYSQMQDGASGPRSKIATGNQGQPIVESNQFIGVDTELRGGNPRPVIPEFRDGITWEGYRFMGWEGEDGEILQNLPYVYPYKERTTYTAVYQPNVDDTYTLTTYHFRDLDEDRNSQTGDAAWPGDEDPNIIKFLGGVESKSGIIADTVVNVAGKRGIPGYIVDSVLIKNDHKRDYGEANGAGSLDSTVTYDNGKVTGTMPNDNLTLAFRYKPDEGRTFTLKVEYRRASEEGLGERIAPTEEFYYSVEDEINVEPQNIPGYILEGGEVTSGTVDALETRGVYGVEGTFNDAWNYTGNMPNQNVTIVYEYDIDPNAQAVITVKEIDDRDNILEEASTYTVNYGETLEYSFCEASQEGYIGTPNIVWDNLGGVESVALNEDGDGLVIQAGTGEGTVTVTHITNYQDSSRWGRIVYYNGQKGSLVGDTSPKLVSVGEHQLSELLGEGEAEGGEDKFTLSAEDGYQFNGWYKASPDGSGKVGERLDTNGNTEVTIHIPQGGLGLYADFVEDPSRWIDLTFAAGANGRVVSGQVNQHLKLPAEGALTWNQLQLPQVQAEEGYTFAGWYNEAGTKMDDVSITELAQIMTSQTFTARFSRIGAGTDDILRVPNAEAKIGTDGNGSVRIQDANADRKYVITDSQKNIVEAKTGLSMETGAFSNLELSSAYYVYELSNEVNLESLVRGEALETVVEEDLRSQPAIVTLLALGNNYSISNDENGNRKIVIRPAASNMVYGVLNSSGEVVSQSGSDWVSASGTPRTAELKGLTSNTTYRVVAKAEGNSDTPVERDNYASTVWVNGSAVEDQTYTILMENGGYVESAGGEVPQNPMRVSATAGSRVWINAPEDNAGRAFEGWEVLAGNVTLENAMATRTWFSMPTEPVRLKATYATDPSATPSNITVEVESAGNVFGLSTLDADMETLKEELTDNSEDQEALNQGKAIQYTVKMNSRTVVATASEAVKDVVGEDRKLAWSMTPELSRKVDGVGREIPQGVDPDLHIYVFLEENDLKGRDYQLWKVDLSDGSVELVNTDGLVRDDSFDGIFTFTGRVGETYVLSYEETCKVRIVDPRGIGGGTIMVGKGNSLEDEGGMELLDELGIESEYTDPVTGISYELDGLSKQAGSSQKYDITDPITRDLILYAVYVEADAEEWQEAWDKLRDEIDTANALRQESSISQTDRDRLTAAVEEAVGILNMTNPRATTAELEAAYNDLKALVDEIRNNSGQGGDDGDEGGSSGSGSGSGGSGSGSTSGVRVNTQQADYIAGVDGTWKIRDNAGNVWGFLLNTGNWAMGRCNIQERNGKIHTYHFDSLGVMTSGWLRDETGVWYYFSTDHDGSFGQMKTGWLWNRVDGKWYYLDAISGKMQIGWKKIGYDWYYLTERNVITSYIYNEDSKVWEYRQVSEHPYGSLYVNAITPDGYQVDSSGKWISEK